MPDPLQPSPSAEELEEGQQNGIARPDIAENGPLPFVLLLNKSDLTEQWAIGDAKLEELRQSGLWVQPSSARTGEGVEDAFKELAIRASS